MVKQTLPGLGLVGFWPLGDNTWKPEMDSNLQTLSVLVSGSVKSRTVALPGSPVAGDVYLVPDSDGTHPNEVAAYGWVPGTETHEWVYYTPQVGWHFLVVDEGINVQWDGVAWVEFAGASTGGSGVPTRFISARAYWTSVAITTTGSWVVLDLETVAGTDPEGIVSVAANTLTVPAGASKVRLILTVQEGGAGGSNQWAIHKNGTLLQPEDGGIALETDNSGGYSNSAMNASTGVLDVVAGDVFDVRAFFSVANTTDGFVEMVVLDGPLVSGEYARPEITVRNQSATSETLTGDDAGTYIRYTAATAISVTVPPDSAGDIPIGAVIYLRQAGAGTVTLVAGSGVTLNASGLSLPGQHFGCSITKVAANTWDVTGAMV